ncbi:MAG: hypothetical protein K2P67_00925 [Gallionellaceae bacterium]|jgi:hypothetical protein|nr:hypothetical protein [Gallionellaceae bacterium]
MPLHLRNAYRLPAALQGLLLDGVYPDHHPVFLFMALVEDSGYRNLSSTSCWWIG